MNFKNTFSSMFTHSRYEHKRSEYKSLFLKQLNILIHSSCRSSYTVEASLALTLVIFASVIFITPMLILNHQRNASVILEDNARMVAQEKYIEYYKTRDGTIKLDTDILNGIETTVSALSLASQIEQPGMKNIDMLSDSEVTDKKIKYVANYEAILPFSVFGLDHLSQQVVASRRAWIGEKGNRWMEDNGNTDDKKDITVYVSTKDSDVYHTTMGCTYITHDIKETSGAAIRDLRTKFGGRFSPCASCRPNTRLSVVYYTSGARSYHSTPTCKTLSSYIQPMKKSEAEAAGKHACVRCG
ncbi:hypothetical protein UYO_1825 [Lachnospiraceae bacterium JC7]|nr:hypothetical protein UYO_1825 [Lachnospiraceae bacterium JC7]